MKNKKNIAMRCNKEQFEAIKPKFEITKEQILELIKDGHPGSIAMAREWFPEVFEVKLEVGKWYIVTNIKSGSLGFEGIGQYTKEKPQSGLLETDLGFNFRDVRGRIWRTNGDIRLATPEEVNEALKNEAVRLGFITGVSFLECKRQSGSQGSLSMCNGNFYFNIYEDGEQVLLSNGRALFCNGQWATVIKTKTIQQAEELLKELGHEIKIV